MVQLGKMQVNGKNYKPCAWTYDAASDVHKTLQM